MNFLQHKTSWANFELSLFKIGVWTCGILFGVYFCSFFTNYLPVIWMISIPLITWAGYHWIQKMNWLQPKTKKSK